MDPILELARRHDLKVIEDCAHSLGATYKGRMVGTLGDASFFSFQAFKPLNTYGGGLAWMRDADLARRVGEFADGEEWPTEKRVESILWNGKWQHTFIRPKVFTYSLFPIWYAASFVEREAGKASLGTRPPPRPAARALPRPVHQRAGGDRPAPVSSACPNSSSGRGGTRACSTICSATCPASHPADAAGPQHVYYQYCAYVPDSEAIVKRCIRRGVDVAPMHVDVCTRMELFGWTGRAAPGAEHAATAVQVPVYESLSDQEIERVGRLGQGAGMRRHDFNEADVDELAAGGLMTVHGQMVLTPGRRAARRFRRSWVTRFRNRSCARTPSAASTPLTYISTSSS